MGFHPNRSVARPRNPELRPRPHPAIFVPKSRVVPYLKVLVTLLIKLGQLLIVSEVDLSQIHFT